MKNDLAERLLDFAADVIGLTMKLSRNYIERHIGKQLFRASTSAGANYEEACAAESRADFIHKLQVVLKETRESRYWLNLLERIKYISDERIPVLKTEVEELAKIFGQSIVTARLNKR